MLKVIRESRGRYIILRCNVIVCDPLVQEALLGKCEESQDYFVDHLVSEAVTVARVSDENINRY
jgi:hypothetical protein